MGLGQKTMIAAGVAVPVALLALAWHAGGPRKPAPIALDVALPGASAR